MKKIFFLLIAIIFANDTFSQTDLKQWEQMKQDYFQGLKGILEKEIKNDESFSDYYVKLVNGKESLSKNAEAQINTLCQPLLTYGNEFAIKHNLKVTDNSDLLSYSLFSPNIDKKTIQGEMIIKDSQSQLQGKLDAQTIGMCALHAIGADAIYALCFSGASSWTIAALTTTFTNAAKRFLGPIGVALAVGSFSYCLYQNY